MTGLLFLNCFFIFGCNIKHSTLESARHIPIQHNGRIKPLDSFARQTVKLIAGTENWQKKEALSTLLEALSKPERIQTIRWIRIDLPELKRSLNLPEDQLFFSFDQIQPSFGQVESYVQSGKAKRGQDIRPSKLEQKAELLYAKLRTIEDLASGESIKVLPGAPGLAWSSPYQSPQNFSPEFKNLMELYQYGAAGKFQEESGVWLEKIYSMTPEAEPQKISVELLYNKVKPFECAAAGYLLSFLFLSVFKRIRLLSFSGFVLLFLAIAFHALGIAARIFVLGRPPVSNMYESMIFMNWAVIIFAVIFSAIRKSTPALVAGSLLSGLVMIYGSLLPIDSSMDVVVAVLRSNYWLTIHVLTVVSSYGAFGLAMALGHRHLFCAVFGKFTKDEEENSAHLIYRVIQLGVILIGTGTVLGGVWANESWGRFWGWDPKETWALITLLGYLVVVHLRHLKKLDNFGLALSSVIGFLLVLMTWYGVNFILGRGLHSYGQGAGGMNWVIYYLVLETLFVGFILYRNRVHGSS